MPNNAVTAAARLLAAPWRIGAKGQEHPTLAFRACAVFFMATKCELLGSADVQGKKFQ